MRLFHLGKAGPRWAAAAVAGAAMLAAAGCGGSSSSSGTSSTPAQSSPSTTSASTNTAPAKTGSKSPIRIGVLSDCKGAFGSFDGQDLAGVVSAISEFAGGKPKDPNDPRKGWEGGEVGGHPLVLTGVGCSDDRADTAIKETRRLMEQLHSDIMIGPLSGDESIAVANYAKQHPNQTFVDGSAGAQDTTMKVQAPNFFRFNGDGAQWDAGTGQIAYDKLGWRTAAVVSDDYSFGWTSTAGFISDFCAAGGKVTSRIFPPLNTTDYSSYVQQMPTDVDGYFIAVGGAGLIPFLKAYEQAKGPIDSKKFVGNLFWATPGEFQQLGPRVAGAYVGGDGTAGDLDSPAAQNYANNIIGKWFKQIPPFGDAAPQAASTFTFGYYINTVGLLKGLEAVKGDISGGQKQLQDALAKVTIDGPYGKVSLDENRQAIFDNYIKQLYMKDGKLAIKSVAKIPKVDQSFGGLFSSKTPAPGRNFPNCVKAPVPWAGNLQPVSVVGG